MSSLWPYLYLRVYAGHKTIPLIQFTVLQLVPAMWMPVGVLVQMSVMPAQQPCFTSLLIMGLAFKNLKTSCCFMNSRLMIWILAATPQTTPRLYNAENIGFQVSIQLGHTSRRLSTGLGQITIKL